MSTNMQNTLERMSQFAPQWSDSQIYREEGDQIFIEQLTKPVISDMPILDVNNVPVEELDLSRSRKCVVGEAHNFGDRYLVDCPACEDFSTKIWSAGRLGEPVTEPLQGFVSHYEETHKKL